LKEVSEEDIGSIFKEIEQFGFSEILAKFLSHLSEDKATMLRDCENLVGCGW
jgi:hypothetical protein